MSKKAAPCPCCFDFRRKKVVKYYSVLCGCGHEGPITTSKENAVMRWDEKSRLGGNNEYN